MAHLGSCDGRPPDTDPQWAAVDEWLRVRLDHHVDKLLDVDGPFAGCIPARGADPAAAQHHRGWPNVPWSWPTTPLWPALMRPPGCRHTAPGPAGTPWAPTDELSTGPVKSDIFGTYPVHLPPG